MRETSGFTLAEVLITLGIIGVVAAMTLPTLIQNYKKQVVETKLAKFYSIMNNAIRFAEAEYGPQESWTDYYVADSKDNNGNVLYDKGDVNDLRIKKYFAPYLKIVNSEDIIGPVYKERVYYLSDGTAFGIGLQQNRDIVFFVSDPEKCLKRENPIGSCMFNFSFLPAVTNVGWVNNEFKYTIGKGMTALLWNWDGKEESLMNDSSNGCKNGSGLYCTAVIQNNGWKIPKDYPRKLY